MLLFFNILKINFVLQKVFFLLYVLCHKFSICFCCVLCVVCWLIYGSEFWFLSKPVLFSSDNKKPMTPAVLSLYLCIKPRYFFGPLCRGSRSNKETKKLTFNLCITLQNTTLHFLRCGKIIFSYVDPIDQW